MTDSPINHGGTWTDEEEAKLLRELGTRMAIREIAEAHHRTVGAIAARQKVVGRRLVLKDKLTLEEAAQRVNIAPFILKQSLDASQVSLTNAQERRDAGVKKEESLLSIMVDIRQLMRQMVANQERIINMAND
jgi:hypothetical protein